MPRGHRGDQDDVGRAGLVRDLAAVESMPGIPRERHATGRDGRLAATKPVRRMSEAREAFGIRCPDAIGLPVVG